MGSVPAVQEASPSEAAHGRGKGAGGMERTGRVAPCPACGAKPRSSDDHRRFFKLIAVAYDQWPERADFQPDSAEHLRAWLLCKAGHRNVVNVELDGEDPTTAVEIARIAVASAGTFAWFAPHGGKLAVVTPKSIAYGEVGQREFGLIRDEVSALIERVIGVSCDQLLKEAEKAA